MSLAATIVKKSTPLRQGFRQRRIQPFVQMLERIHREHGAVQLLDVGGTRRYWDLIPAATFEELNVFVTVVNFASESFEDQPRFRYLEGNGCHLPSLNDNSYDIVHSNSVIEHVGTWEHMAQFAHEVRRLAPRYWVQTPYFWFPIEPHCMTPFFHWLPWPLRVKLVQRLRLGNWPRAATLDEAVRTVESARLLDQAMMQDLFPEAKVRVERLMLLPKSLIMVRE